MKRILAVGCSHGHHMNHEAAKAVLKFKLDYKPHMTIHLGDFLDLSAFMGKKVGTGEGEDPIHDMRAGFEFLEELEPDILFMGNHEDRLWNLLDHNRELVRYAARDVIGKIEGLAKRMKAETVPYGGVHDANSWRNIGGVAYGHGYLYNEQCARDHAEMLGMPCVFAHVHKLLRQAGRAHGAPEGISAGCLASIPAMTYAKNRRATAAWDNGFVFGEYSDKGSKLYLERTHSWQRPEIPQRG